MFWKLKALIAKGARLWAAAIGKIPTAPSRDNVYPHEFRYGEFGNLSPIEEVRLRALYWGVRL